VTVLQSLQLCEIINILNKQKTKHT